MQQPTSPSSSRRGVVGVVLEEDRFLVIRRSVHVRAPRAYCFPGGGIESGESEEAALIREMHEELSVGVRPTRRLWQNVTPSGVLLAWWRAELVDSRPPVPNPAEVESVHWMDASTLRKMQGLLSTNRDFLDAWQRSHFSLDP